MVKLLGHVVQDGEQIWLISSGAEVGFRVTGATRVTLRLRADNTVISPETETMRPRFAVLLDGRKKMDARMTAKDATVTVFEEGEKRDAEIRLIKLLGTFPGKVAEAGAALSPAVLANYAYDLAKEFNQYYHETPILREEDQGLLKFRLELISVMARTLRTAMGILGIGLPDRM